MERELRTYFKAEKQESLLFLGLGLLALLIGLGFVFCAEDARWRGMALPLMGIACIQLIVGGTVFFRTDRQVQELLTLLHSKPKDYQQIELQRMEKVNANFKIYRNVELLLLLLGLVFCFMGALGNWGKFILGSGIGLALQSGIMLVLDLFAEWRAGLYTHKVRRLKL